MTLQTARDSAVLHANMPNLAGTGHFTTSSPVNLQSALDEIRYMKEFQPPQANPLENLLEQPSLKELGQKISHAFTTLLDALARLLSKAHVPKAYHLPEAIKDIFSGFIGFMLVLAGLFTLYLLLGWILRLTDRAEQAKKKEIRIFDDTLLTDSAQHAKDAQRYAQEGNYTEGIRQWYLALLCLLDETQVVPFSKTRSNLEYRDLMLASPDQWSGLFEHLAHQFERVRYGQVPGEKSQFQQCQHWYEQLKQGVAKASHA